jgi:hypothetical protein
MNRIVFLLVMFFSFGLNAQTAKEILINASLPDDWKIDNLQSYEGDDLFFLINGGADLYFEYGFLDVAAADFKHPSLGKFYAEVYRMENDSAAFGVFSLGKGHALIKIEPSPWINYGNKFMHVWKSNYYITISGADFKAEGLTMEYVNLMIAFTDKINSHGNTPLLFDEFYATKRTDDFAYVLGYLALNNVYSFGFQDIFDVNEAVMIDYTDYKVLIFQYNTEDVANKTYGKVTESIKTSNRFMNFSSEDDNLFSVTDRNDKVLILSVNGSRIEVRIR